MSTFFKTTQLIFRALPKNYEDPDLVKFSAPQAKKKAKGSLKKQAKKRFLALFGKFRPKKFRFFGALSPQN